MYKLLDLLLGPDHGTPNRAESARNLLYLILAILAGLILESL